MKWNNYVLIPYLALIAIAILERKGGWDTAARKLLELGIDACILGIGVTGALLAGPVKLGDQPPNNGLVITILLVEIIIAGLALNCRIWTRPGETSRAMLTWLFGATILVFNSLLVLWYT
ncbi:MAG: hypothetical protein ACREQB_01035 [Candidatus Binataceae bacterium]